MTASGRRRSPLSRIFTSALIVAGVAATCAAASPGHSASGGTAAVSTAGPAAKPAAKAVTGTAATGATVTLTDPGDQVARVLPETVSLQLSAKDSAASPLSYTATALPPGLTIDPATGLISGAVTAYFDGTVSVTATDAADVSATASFSWLAENAIYLAPMSKPIQSSPDAYASLQIRAGDPEAGEPVTYSATGLPPGLSINPATGLINGTTTAATGSYDVTATASDPTGSSASVSFTWRVWNTITVAYATGTIQAGAALSVPVTATDSEAGQTFTFSATGLPPGVSIDPASGVITGSATADGVYDVTVTATDSGGSQGSTTGYWTVNGRAAIASPGNLVTTAGQLARIPLKVGDPADNAWLYYAIVGGPPGSYVNWNSSTPDGWRSATLTGWPAPVGTYKTTISLIGTLNSTASVTFTWTVKAGPATGPTGPVRLDLDGKCLDDTGNSAKVGTKLRLWSCTNHTNQMWTAAYEGELAGPASGLCVSDPAVRSGTGPRSN
jgi:Putative Ig domain/Ricin-type beta-trefoil lectin domain